MYLNQACFTTRQISTVGIDDLPLKSCIDFVHRCILLRGQYFHFMIYPHMTSSTVYDLTVIPVLEKYQI